MKTKTTNRTGSNNRCKIVLITICTFLIFASQLTYSQVAPPPPPPPPVTQPGQQDDGAYILVDVMPQFPGGEQELLKYIALNTRYPKEAKDKNISGRVIVRFKVSAEGTVTDASVLKGVEASLDNEALRVVKTIPKFSPGQYEGKSVPVWYMIPITFALNNSGDQRPSRYFVSGSDTIYTYTSNSPLFPGGNEAYRKFRDENLNYPPEIKSLGIEGLVVVSAIIEKDGSLTGIRVERGVSPTLDAEAIRVTKMMPAMKPATDKGKPVKYQTSFAYQFMAAPIVPVAPTGDEPFVVVEEMPMFPGGDSALLSFIAKNTKYPENAKKNGIQGRVIVRFCITATGGIDKVTVLKGVDADLDAEAIRVVSTLPKFKPGKQGGKPVPVWYMVPITFALDGSPNKVIPPTPPVSTAAPVSQFPGYDEPPFFKGGEKKMYKIISKKIKYPASATEKKITGKVPISFIITTEGKISNITVSKSLNPELDQEAVRVIKLLPDFKPGKLEGKPVQVQYSVNVNFNLK